MREVRVKPKSNLAFRLMSLTYKLRDFLRLHMRVLDEVGIKEGFNVLDYGCGPGSYLVPLVKLVGKSGKVYALDIHPLAIQRMQRMAVKRGIKNVQAILSDCQTRLPSNSMDVVLLYDILHDLDDPHRVLEELHRVLRPKGILSVSDHHMKQDEIDSKITRGGLYKLSVKEKRTYSFTREEG